MFQYKMDSDPRGFCLIINNRIFGDALKHYEWNEIDEKQLEKLFRDDLSFTVTVKRYLRGKQMLDLATQFSQMDHGKYDAFVFIIMSDGGERDAVCCVDDESIGIELLMSHFQASKCPSLENKPKLFFVQACRGNRAGDVSSDAIRRHLSDFTLPRSVCPNEADFLLFFVTTPVYQSFRHPWNGSPFIQVYTYVISINVAFPYLFCFFC